MSTDWEFRIARLELEAGDVLVVQGGCVKPENSHDALRSLIPRGVRILYMPDGVNLSVLTRKQIEEMAA